MTQQQVFLGLIIVANLVLYGCNDPLETSFVFGVAKTSSSSSSSSSDDSGDDGEAPVDDDGDGLSNTVEELFSINTLNTDTDFDGFGDGLEFGVDTADPLDGFVTPDPQRRAKQLEPIDVISDPIDSDRDGLGDRFESDNSLKSDSADTDEDGYDDAVELIASSDPFDSSDRPSRTEPPVSDGQDRFGSPPRDTDGDGLADELESGEASNTSTSDTDSDGFSDGVEYVMGSDLLSADNVPNFVVPEPPES